MTQQMWSNTLGSNKTAMVVVLAVATLAANIGDRSQPILLMTLRVVQDGRQRGKQFRLGMGKPRRLLLGLVRMGAV